MLIGLRCLILNSTPGFHFQIKTSCYPKTRFSTRFSMTLLILCWYDYLVMVEILYIYTIEHCMKELIYSQSVDLFSCV